MKNLKQKFKRALAGFLKEELLDYIGYNHKIPFMSLNDRFMVNELPFETMVMEFDVSLFENIGTDLAFESSMRFEKAIEDAKKKFSNQIMDHIHVETRELTNHQFFGRRSIKLVLRVQGKQY